MIQISKKLLRNRLRKKRNNLSESKVKSLSILISKSLNQDKFFVNCKNVVGYVPFENEPIISFYSKKEVLLPKINNMNLTFHRNTKEFQINKYGISEPKNTEIIPIDKIKLILIPLIAFNKSLFRIGYGGGYYDRTLSDFQNKKNRPKLWGIGYDFQLTNTNFQSNSDIRLDKVITEKNIYV